MNNDKVETQKVVVAGLQDQITDFGRKERLLRGATKDLDDKKKNLLNTMRQRDDEGKELFRVLKTKRDDADRMIG